jgi:hypothetical protein
MCRHDRIISRIKHVPSAAELKLDVQHANSAATNAANRLRAWYDALLPTRQGTPYQESLEDAMRKMDSILYQIRRVCSAVPTTTCSVSPGPPAPPNAAPKASPMHY